MWNRYIGYIFCSLCVYIFLVVWYGLLCGDLLGFAVIIVKYTGDISLIKWFKSLSQKDVCTILGITCEVPLKNHLKDAEMFGLCNTDNFFQPAVWLHYYQFKLSLCRINSPREIHSTYYIPWIAYWVLQQIIFRIVSLAGSINRDWWNCSSC